MSHVRTTRQCKTAVCGSMYRSGRALPPGFVEIAAPREAIVADHVDPDQGSGDGIAVASSAQGGADPLDPVSQAIGFWNWMIDNGYEPSADERPTS